MISQRYTKTVSYIIGFSFVSITDRFVCCQLLGHYGLRSGFFTSEGFVMIILSLLLDAMSIFSTLSVRFQGAEQLFANYVLYSLEHSRNELCFSHIFGIQH